MKVGISLFIWLPIFFSSLLAFEAKAENSEELTIGVILDLTGPSASLGEDCRQGFEIAKQAFLPEMQVNGRALRFILGDSKGDPKTALLEFSRMVDSEHALAVMVSRTRIAMALNPASRQKQVSLLASSAHPQFVSENAYAFRIWPRADQEGEALAERALVKGAKNVALITTQEDYLVSMSDSFSKSMLQRGGKIVLDERIDNEFMDFSTLSSKLLKRDPDAVFLNVNIPQLGVAYRRLHELGLKKPFFSSYWVFKKEVLEAAGPEALEGVVAVEMDYLKPKFSAAVRAQFGHDPLSAMTYSCYVGTAQILQTIKQSPTIKSAAEMYPALLNSKRIHLLDDDALLSERELQVPLVKKSIKLGKAEPLAE